MSANQKATVDKAEAPKAKHSAPELKAGELYTIVGTGTSKRLVKGQEYEGVHAADAALLIESGKATLKAK